MCILYSHWYYWCNFAAILYPFSRVERLATRYNTHYFRFWVKAFMVAIKIKGQPTSLHCSFTIYFYWNCFTWANLASDFLVLNMWYQVSVYTKRNLLAVAVGIKQKYNVDAMVQKVFFYNLLGYENDLKQQSLSNFIDFSFSQEILRLFCSIMMPMWMDGGILTGVAKSYI